MTSDFRFWLKTTGKSTKSSISLSNCFSYRNNGSACSSSLLYARSRRRAVTRQKRFSLKIFGNYGKKLKSASDVTTPMVMLMCSVSPGRTFPISGLSTFMSMRKLLNSLSVVISVS